MQLGKPKVLYFGEILKYLYASPGKNYGDYNGTLPEKYFYKPSIKLPFAPAWTLEDMVAAAKKQGIKIEYATVYKTLAIQEQEFAAKNSKTPTNVSKTSSISEIKNGRIYAGVRWYTKNVTSYNPLPGFNIFGTGLCIKIKNNNDKIINFIKNNCVDYGWSWCGNVPTTDPDFQNILVYSAGMSKPLKYRDRTAQEVDGFKPTKPPAGAPGPGQKQVWVPDEKGTGKGGSTITGVDPDTGKKFETPTIFGGGTSETGRWVIVPDSTTKTTTITQVKPIGSSPWDNNIIGKINGPTVLVANGTNVNGYANKLAETLAYIGMKAPFPLIKKNITFGFRGRGDSPLAARYTSVYEYIWGLRREVEISTHTATVPYNATKALELGLKDTSSGGFYVESEFKNVSAISYENVMTWADEQEPGNFVEQLYDAVLRRSSARVAVDNPLNIEKYNYGVTPPQSIIYYLPEYKNYVEKNFVPLLDKLNGRIIDPSTNVVYKKETLYKYTLKQAPSALEQVMKYGKTAIVSDLSYVLQKLEVGQYTFDGNIFSFNPLKTITVPYVGLDPITGKIRSVLVPDFFISKFKSIKKWPANTQTPDKNPSNHWAQVVIETTQGDKIYPLRLTYKTIGPFNIMLILGADTVLDGPMGGYLQSNVLKERIKIDEILRNPNIRKDIPVTTTVPSAPTTTIPAKPTTSTTIPKATTTTTIPKKSTTTTVAPKSTTTTVAPKIVYPDQRDGLSPTTTITRPNVTTITNKVPIIIGDSIAKGLSDRYDFLNPGVETSQVVPNVFLYSNGEKNIYACQDETLFSRESELYGMFCVWDGYHHKVGDDTYEVNRRITNVLRYIDQKDKQLNNRILWLSTGASNEIRQASDVASALNHIEIQFDDIKAFTDRKKIALVYVIGISKQLNDKYPGTYFNLKLEMLCKKYGYIFVGDFDASNDSQKIHPPNYISIVDGLIAGIPTAPINVPPTSTTTPTTVPIGTTTTSLPSSTTTVTKYIPAAPGARPGAGAAGIGAPRPIATTTTSTTIPRATTTTTLPAQQSTTTIVKNPNGSTTTTTIVFPPKIPVLPPYTPSTSTTVAPNGTSTTTTVVANGATTTTVVTPSTTTAPANGSPSSTIVTTVPVTTVPMPKITLPDQRDGVAPPTTTIPLGPTVPEPKFLSYSVTSLTPENDNKKVNIDVKLTLEFDLSMVRGSGSIFFYKKNTSKALAKIDIFSSEVSFLDYNSITITPKNVLPYNTDISVFIGAHVLKSSAGKSWSGNAGKWDSITFTTIPDPNTPVAPVAPAPSPTPAPKPKPTKPKPVNPNPTPGVTPSKPAPVIPGNPDVTPPNETVQPPTDSVIVINDPVKNETTLQSNDGLWARDAELAGTKFKSLKQDLIISQIASHTSWILEFNISDDAGVVKNIGKIGLERDAPKCTGETESLAVCFFSMYGGMKSIPELAVDRYRQAPCENRVTDHGPGLSLRNKLIWRNGDSFEFRVSLSESQTQEYNVTYKCLSTERPLAPGFSETIYETDTDKIYMWNGLEWFQIASATLNIAQAAIFDNPNTFIINGNWWYGMVWNKTLRRTYPLGKIFVPSDYLNIDATRNYVRYSGPESEKTNVKERKASAKFITPIGFSLDGARGVYKSQ